MLEVVAGTERELPCELLIIAAGFLGCEDANAKAFSLTLTKRGNPETIGASHMVAPGRFVAGDMHTGQSLVVRAIADGKQAAAQVHEYIMNK